jgi:hypothetical protein
LPDLPRLGSFLSLNGQWSSPAKWVWRVLADRHTMPRTERQEELVSIGEIVATAVIRKGKNRFDTLFFSGMAVVILASALVGFAPDLLSGRSVQGSSTAELARTHPWCGLFLVDPFADCTNRSGRQTPGGYASPVACWGSLWRAWWLFLEFLLPPKT